MYSENGSKINRFQQCKVSYIKKKIKIDKRLKSIKYAIFALISYKNLSLVLGWGRKICPRNADWRDGKIVVTTEGFF